VDGPAAELELADGLFQVGLLGVEGGQLAPPGDDAGGAIDGAETHPPVGLQDLPIERDEAESLGRDGGGRDGVRQRRHDQRPPQQPPQQRRQLRREGHVVDHAPQRLRAGGGVEVLPERLEAVQAEHFGGGVAAEGLVQRVGLGGQVVQPVG